MEKRRNDGKSAQAAGISPRLATAIAVVFVACTVALTLAGAPVERVLGRSLEFRARELLGRGPELDGSLKVFAFDDEAAATRGGTELSVDEWAQVIRLIASRSPRTILIDRSFPHPLPDGDSRRVGHSLIDLPSTLVGKAIVAPQALRHLNELPTERFGMGFPKLIPDATERTRRPPAWTATPRHRAYGPTGALAEAFDGIGHGQVREGGTIRPFVTLAETALLPHWSLLALGSPQILGGDLLVAGQAADLTEDGELPVNLVDAARCDSRIVSLAGLIADATASDLTLASVMPGDTVVILTDLRQASTTTISTPLGPMPEAFVELASVSSTISGRWLAAYPGRVPLMVLFILLAAFLAVRLDRHHLMLSVLGFTALLTVAGVLAFALGGAQIPWFGPASIFLLSGLAAAIAGLRQDQARMALLRRDLDGRISPEKLEAFLGQDAVARLEATEQVVTIMFIDIVGFSRSAEKQAPKEAFSSLKGLIDQMRRAVHEHGGVVDRTMGDGMLCVFGYDMGGDGATGAQHAVQAVSCAASIQRENMRRMLRAGRTHEAVFPLRIGVNTAGVYLGNLGDDDRTDLTVIGSGVNLAQRLEAACDRHMVMLGAATHDVVQGSPELVRGLRKRHIRVKHSSELVEAYEFDPFQDQGQLLLDGDEAYRQLIGIERSEARWPIPYPGLVRVSTTYGDGEMLNFSLDGFTIRLPGYYAKDVGLTLRMDTEDGELAARLERAGLESIMLEVRWARPDDSGYVHGCQIKSLSREQRGDVIRFLRDAIQRHGMSSMKVVA